MNPKPSLILLSALLLLAAFRVEAANGLEGRYFDEYDFTSQVTSRTDPTVDFDWGTTIPAGTVLTSVDYFSVRWTGQIEPQFPETYTFYVAADNGSRLWIDGKCQRRPAEARLRCRSRSSGSVVRPAQRLRVPSPDTRMTVEAQQRHFSNPLPAAVTPSMLPAPLLQGAPRVTIINWAGCQ